MVDKKKGNDIILVTDPSDVFEAQEQLTKSEPLLKQLVDDLDSFQAERISYNRKSFTLDPLKADTYYGLYRRRDNLIPYFVLKQLADNDSLVATILNTRASQISAFGHPQVNRHDVGYKICFRNEKIEDSLSSEDKQVLMERMDRCRDLFYHCGQIEGFKLSERQHLPTFLKETVRSALLFGFNGTEIIRNEISGNFCGFRNVDAGTIYMAPLTERENNDMRILRQTAFKDLERLKGKEQIDFNRLNPADFESGAYQWVQVISNIPRQAFKDDELLVKQYYPVTDIENNGYPRPPIDTVAKGLATHIAIATMNHMYFLNGRAAKGFLTLTGENVNENIVQRIRQQFNASINSAANAHRMPVFGSGEKSKVEWVPMDPGGKDGEFLSLMDNNAREIMSAFSITPDELPGYGHLSRPTATQALSETNNQYNLQVARSAGLKPILMEVQGLMNDILRQMDPLVHKYCTFRFMGFEAEDATKESARLQMESNLHLTANEMMRQVGKQPLPIGGSFPMNPQLMNLLKQQIPQNLLQYAFTGDKASLTDPALMYTADGFYFQWISMFPELLKSRGRVQHALQDCLNDIKAILLEEEIE